MTYTGHKQKAMLFFLSGLFVIVLGLGQHESIAIAAQPTVVSNPNGISDPITTSIPLEDGTASHNKKLALPGDTERFFRRYPSAVAKVNHQKKKKIRQILEEIAQTSQPVSAAVLNHKTKGPGQEAKQRRKITTLERPSKLANFSAQLEKTPPTRKKITGITGQDNRTYRSTGQYRSR